jgi:hypothetical protein
VAFIRIKEIKGKKYAYRQTSVRTGRRVRSIMQYLGPVGDNGSIPTLSPYEDPPGPIKRLFNRFRPAASGDLDEQQMIARGWVQHTEEQLRVIEQMEQKSKEALQRQGEEPLISPTPSPSSAPLSSPSPATPPSDSSGSETSLPSSASPTGSSSEPSSTPGGKSDGNV